MFIHLRNFSLMTFSSLSVRLILKTLKFLTKMRQYSAESINFATYFKVLLNNYSTIHHEKTVFASSAHGGSVCLCARKPSVNY